MVLKNMTVRLELQTRSELVHVSHDTNLVQSTVDQHFSEVPLTVPRQSVEEKVATLVLTISPLPAGGQLRGWEIVAYVKI